MTTYSIGDLEAITGVKAHTIRTWEQRYHILTPERTSTNIRQYSETQLRILASLAFLIRQRVKISQLIGLSEEELREQVRRHLDVRSTHATQDTELLKMIAIQMDEEKFEKFFSTLILQRGFERAASEVFFPFVEHIFLLWNLEPHLAGMEVFITSLLRRKMHTAIETLVPPRNHKPRTTLLFLPKDYHHELPLLFCWYELRKEGHRVVYLGGGLSAHAVATTARKIEADDALCAVISNRQDVSDYLKTLCEEMKDDAPRISLIGGTIGPNPAEGLPVQYYKSLASFRKGFGL